MLIRAGPSSVNFLVPLGALVAECRDNKKSETRPSRQKTRSNNNNNWLKERAGKPEAFVK